MKLHHPDHPELDILTGRRGGPNGFIPGEYAPTGGRGSPRGRSSLWGKLAQAIVLTIIMLTVITCKVMMFVLKMMWSMVVERR